MRTTLTLDPDVAALLKRIQEERKCGLKEVVNDALRAGLIYLEAPKKHVARYHTRSVSLGACLVGSIDDVAEVVELAAAGEPR